MAIKGKIFLTTMLILLSITSGAADEPKKPAEEKSRGTKASWGAELVRRSVAPAAIPELIISESKLVVTLVPRGGKLRPSVEIRGSFNRPGWSLSIDRSLLLPPQKTGKQSFSVVAYLNGRLSEVSWTARGPNGEVITEPILLLAPDAQEFRIAPKWGELMFFSGYTSLSYFQTQLDHFSSKSILLAGEFMSTKGRSRFGLAGAAQANVFSLSGTPSQYRPLHLGVKADVTYDLMRMSPKRLRFTPLLGVSYSTMFSNGSPFGFSNLAAVEIGTLATYDLKPGTNLVADLRYIPIKGIIALEQAEVDFGIGWTKQLENFHRVQIDLRYSNLAYKPNEPTVIHNRIISLRIGYNI